MLCIRNIFQEIVPYQIITVAYNLKHTHGININKYRAYSYVYAYLQICAFR